MLASCTHSVTIIIPVIRKELRHRGVQKCMRMLSLIFVAIKMEPFCKVLRKCALYMRILCL